MHGEAAPVAVTGRSVAFDARTAMVVDANGDLFSTQDIGEHWVEITPQWQGKAIALKLDSAPSGGVTHPTAAAPLVNGSIGGAGNGSIGGPVAGIRVAPSVFELTNEQGQVWLSSDEGQTWHLK